MGGFKVKDLIYVSGNRADFGLMEIVLKKIQSHPDFKVSVLALGMHMMARHGNTIEILRDSGLDIIETNVVFQSDSRGDMTHFISQAIDAIGTICEERKPDALLLLGDRPEMLAAAIVGVYHGIPNLHIHGGDLSGTLDEIVRHSITKLSHVHFAATEESRKRIIRLGEMSEHVYLVGAPGLDGLEEMVMSRDQLQKSLAIEWGEKLILFLQHPDIDDPVDLKTQIDSSLKAVISSGATVIMIYPNADAGNHIFIEQVERYRKFDRVYIYKNVPRNIFISLLAHADVMVGNSSAGIIEAGFFNLPVVNVGDRQKNRARSSNVLSCDFNEGEIADLIKTALSKMRARKTPHSYPYGNGKAAERIIEILDGKIFDERIFQKQLNY